MLFGTNIWNWQNAKIKTQGHTSVRYYFDVKHGVPASWPTLPEGLVGIVSIRPNIMAVANGSLDKQLAELMVSAPDNSKLVIWHEANQPKKGLDPTAYKVACKRVRDLAVPWVKVGQILETYPVTHGGQSLTPWVDDNMDFWYLDGYQLTDADTPESVFGDCIDQALSLGAYLDAMGIAETNSATEPSTWCYNAAQYARNYRLQAFAVFAQDASAPPPTFLNLPDDHTMATIAATCATSGN